MIGGSTRRIFSCVRSGLKPANNALESLCMVQLHCAPSCKPYGMGIYTSTVTYVTEEEFRFEVIHRSTRSNARVGRIHTRHGVVDTPGYVAVATNGALKCVDFDAADASGLQLVFCNTYHLLIHPGTEVVQSAGGLHEFVGRRKDRPFITDSGGFQVFSLAYGSVHDELHSLKRKHGSSLRLGNKVKHVGPKGVVFKSYRDGTDLLLSPETSVRAQKEIGADIILPLDELPPYHVTRERLAESLHRTHQWELWSLEEHLNDRRGQAMYGIIHGGSDLAFRTESVSFLQALAFDGWAIGGALGKNRMELYRIVSHVMKELEYSPFKPCHVLGIADPYSLKQLAQFGCDTFDSCYATQLGRHGCMLAPDEEGGIIKVGAGKYKSEHRRPSASCSCPTCRGHTLSYLHHLVKANEPLSKSLLSLHNIYYMVNFMKRIRENILLDRV